MNELKWSTELPTDIGWYWVSDSRDNWKQINVVYVRDYVGELAIANSHIRHMTSCKWAGPILPPKEEAE